MREFETGNRQSGTISFWNDTPNIGASGQADTVSIMDEARRAVEMQPVTASILGAEGGGAVLEALDPTGIAGVLRAVFSPGFASRFSAVLIGIVLIGLAIAAFVLTSDKTQTIIGKAIPNG